MKHYDKIFFLVSILVLGASLGYFFMQKPELEQTKKSVDKVLAESAKGVQWQDLAVPDLNISMIEWPEIRPQDDEGKWFFQVFTPPKIWVDRNGIFETESPYYKELRIAKFSLRYGGVSNEPYHIKYLGYLGTKESPRIQFADEKSGLGFTGKFQEEIVVPEPSTGKPIDMGLKVTGFDIKRVKNENNTISEIITVKLFDKNLGKEVTIYSNKPTVLEDEQRMTFITSDGGQWHVKKVGEERVIDGAKYVVKSLDFENGKAVVQMIPPASSDSPSVQTMQLSADGIVPVN